VFQIAPIPFGGFVEIRGMNIAEDIDPDDKFAYPNRPAWQRFVTIFAGPATNYLSAIVLAFAAAQLPRHAEPAGAGTRSRCCSDGYDATASSSVGDRIIAVERSPILAKGRYTAPDGAVYVADGLTAASTGCRRAGSGRCR
jgi:regulator of sigma E protease